jgi:formate hydrogenlyase subunit 3/multisubunit Na+/H+ antiporter MnhD subunit
MPCVLFRSARGHAERAAAGLAVLGGAIGVFGTILALGAGAEPVLSADWWLPIGQFRVSIDAISAAFLFPFFLVPALCAVYGLGYWARRSHPDTAGYVRAFFGVLGAAMVMVVISRDGVLFLFSWEIMALAAFFLVATEQDREEARAASWIYFVAAHVGTLCLFALFALLHNATGTFRIGPIVSGDL